MILKLPPLIPLTCALASLASAQFTLVETGGTFSATQTNVASAANGATPFASQVFAGSPSHTIAHLNDGNYGNSFSWLGNNSVPNTVPSAGVLFSSAQDINSFAFGRDQTGGFTDRFATTYFIFYTRDTDLNAGNAMAATWSHIGNLDYVTSPPISPSQRHLYSFGETTGVTGFRIDMNLNSIAIDEIEIYSVSAVPEPASAAALAGFAMLGMVATRRRRRA